MKQSEFERAEKIVVDFVKADLDGYFKGAFVFDPIRVEPRIDYWGDGEEYFLVEVVFEGDQGKLDPHWTGGLVMRILPEMQKRGIEAWPVPRFIEKSEWDGFERKENRKRKNVAARS